MSLVGLSACADALETVSAVYQEGGEKAVEITATVHTIECARSVERRKEFVNDVNQELFARGKTGHAIAQDCNGDGNPDF